MNVERINEHKKDEPEASPKREKDISQLSLILSSLIS